MIHVLLMFSTRPVIILKTRKFKPSDILGTHTLLDTSLGVLQLPINLSNLTANG